MTAKALGLTIPPAMLARADDHSVVDRRTFLTGWVGLPERCRPFQGPLTSSAMRQWTAALVRPLRETRLDRGARDRISLGRARGLA
jgi:hypothetical protein